MRRSKSPIIIVVFLLLACQVANFFHQLKHPHTYCWTHNQESHSDDSESESKSQHSEYKSHFTSDEHCSFMAVAQRDFFLTEGKQFLSFLIQTQVASLFSDGFEQVAIQFVSPGLSPPEFRS